MGLPCWYGVAGQQVQGVRGRGGRQHPPILAGAAWACACTSYDYSWGARHLLRLALLCTVVLGRAGSRASETARPMCGLRAGGCSCWCQGLCAHVCVCVSGGAGCLTRSPPERSAGHVTVGLLVVRKNRRHLHRLALMVRGRGGGGNQAAGEGVKWGRVPFPCARLGRHIVVHHRELQVDSSLHYQQGQPGRWASCSCRQG